MAALPPGLDRLVWTGVCGEAEIDGRTVPVADMAAVPGLVELVAAHAARLAEISPASGRPPDVSMAVRRQLANIARQSASLQDQQMVHEGRQYYADRSSLETITTTLAIVQMLSDNDPVPTPPPVTGCWLTADVDQQTGQRVAVAMTCGAFKLLARALYDRNALLWGAKQLHCATVEAMAAGGATAEQILQYDHTAGWPTT